MQCVRTSSSSESNVFGLRFAGLLGAAFAANAALGLAAALVPAAGFVAALLELAPAALLVLAAAALLVLAFAALLVLAAAALLVLAVAALLAVVVAALLVLGFMAIGSSESSDPETDAGLGTIFANMDATLGVLSSAFAFFAAGFFAGLGAKASVKSSFCIAQHSIAQHLAR